MRTLTLTLVLVLSACSTPADTYSEVLPDDRLLITDFDTNALARGIGEPSDYYELTRQTVSDVNTGVGEVLRLLETITSYDPTWTDESSTALWGPWLDGGVYGQLWVKQDADESYSWAIELRPEDSSEEDWVGAVAGHIDPGASETESAGYFVLDFTAIDSVGAGDGETGEFGCRYDIREKGAAVEAAFGDISEDGSLPQDGVYRYEHTIGVGGQMDVAVEQDLDDPNGVLELLFIRSRWVTGGAGRADAAVTGGDLGALTYTETDCWDEAHQTVFFENNYELVSEGDESLCAFSEASYSEEQ